MTETSEQDGERRMRFAEHTEIDAAPDQLRLNALAAAVVNQQAAGFGEYIDTREVHCANCGASGFNTGWGYWHFSCGLELLSDGEGECSPCAAPPTTGGER